MCFRPTSLAACGDATSLLPTLSPRRLSKRTQMEAKLEKARAKEEVLDLPTTEVPTASLERLEPPALGTSIVSVEG